MTSRFFAEDTVALKEDPSIIATVQGTWHDLDSGIFSPHSDFITHKDISPSVLREFSWEAHVPVGYAIIEFVEPYEGSTLIRETELLLRDRGLVVGDVVKRLPSDPASGTVIKTSIQCTIEPIYTELPYHGSEQWPHKPEENRLCVPAEELQCTDVEHDDFVFYGNFFGEVTNVIEQVTIRLENGSVVRVHDAYDLQVPCCLKYLKKGKKNHNLVSLLKRAKKRMKEDGSRPPLQYHEGFYPGMVVYTKKSNLRLGNWLIGSYSPSVPPRGIVVESRAIGIEVDWLTRKFVDDDQTEREMPDETLGLDELQQIKVFNGYGGDSNTTTLYGSRYTSKAGVGDRLKFRDKTGASKKYSNISANHGTNGIFREIPRTITQGFDMNIFTIQDTKTKVTIQWQDGSVTEQDSTSLIPYMNVDENDVWVGEIVSVKSAEVKKDGLLMLKEVGVVQAVDARERLARVRWYQDPQASIFEDDPSMLVPGSTLGKLSERESLASLYEVATYPPLARRRGDIVVVQSEEHVENSVMHQEKLEASREDQPLIPGAFDAEIAYAQDTINHVTPGTELGAPTLNDRNGPSTQDYRWLGEIVDLGLDGLLTVRVGTVGSAKDVRVPADQVILVVGGDDEDYSSEGDAEDEDDDESSDFSMDDAPQTIEETITYQGATPSDSAEDAWMTSDEDDHGDADNVDDDEDVKDKKMQYGHNEVPSVNDNHAEKMLLNSTTNATINHVPTSPKPRLKLGSHNEYNFSKFSNMPQPFDILDESAPIDHHFFSKTSSGLSASFLRRITKEHGMIKDSLPEGIWVRTWSERLDLVRVLICGPHGTPYSLAPFVFDFHFSQNFPSVPPEGHFHSWAVGGRINPNLYEDGKICLSLLGTWPEGGESEGWNPNKSSLLQVVVSLLGLVLVEEPFYNEAGFETLIGTEESIVPSRIYSEKALCMAKGFVDYALTNEVVGLDSVVKWLYVDPQGPFLLKVVVADSRALCSRQDDSAGNEENDTTKQDERLSKGAEFLLRRYLGSLESRLVELERT